MHKSFANTSPPFYPVSPFPLPIFWKPFLNLYSTLLCPILYQPTSPLIFFFFIHPSLFWFNSCGILAIIMFSAFPLSLSFVARNNSAGHVDSPISARSNSGRINSGSGSNSNSRGVNESPLIW